MQTLSLDPGDLLQIKSTDLPSGAFIKLQAQSTSFLDISDPKAVLEQAFRNFSCLTQGDIFTFAYNDQIYEMAVLETKPGGEGTKNAVSVLETDLEVDFAPPVGYEEPQSKRGAGVSGTSTPRGGGAVGSIGGGGMLHNAGTMAQAINYAAIAPQSTTAAAGAKAVSSNFLSGGHKLKGGKAPTPKASTPVAGTSTNPPPTVARRTNGPQPLRLPPGKLFFGYEHKPVRKSGEGQQTVDQDDETSKPRFQGQGQTLRKNTTATAKKEGGGTKRRGVEVEKKAEDDKAKEKEKEKGDAGGGGRTLRDSKK